MIICFSDGSVAVVHKYSGETRLTCDCLSRLEACSWDAIVSRPMRPCSLRSGLYIPSICNRMSSIPVLDFDSLVFSVREAKRHHG